MTNKFGNFECIEHQFENRDEMYNFPPLPPFEVFGTINGCSGSGKTSVLLDIIPLFKKIKYILVFSTMTNPIYNSIEKWAKRKKINFVFEQDIDEAKKILLETVNKKKKEDQVLVIMDDFNDCLITSNKTNPYVKMVNTIYTKMRNLNVHAFYVVQRYIDIPTVVRNNVNIQIFFKMVDDNAIHGAAKDFAAVIGNKNGKNIFYSLMDKISQPGYKHSFFIGTNDDIHIFLNGYHDKITKVEPIITQNKIKDDESDSESENDEYD